jgi:hypothetical protein
MIIHQPEIVVRNGELVVSARVELKHPVEYIPQELWFAFPETYAKYITGRSDGFATSLIQTAMYFDENLEIRGEISPRLAYGLQEYQKVFHAWFPNVFNLVDIKYDKLISLPSTEVLGKVGTTFSGGVDSLYTLWSGLSQNQSIPSAQVTHGLFIHGFDLRLYEQEKYIQINEQYVHTFEQLGLELLKARTNGAQFWEFRIRWEYVHGGLLIGTALQFGRLLSSFYVPSTISYQKLTPMATSPITDHWLSTETMDIIHHGASLNRIQKLAVLSGWEISHNLLRVCTDITRREGIKNCSQCDKCLRTMIMLDLIDELPKFTTFQKQLRARNIMRYALFLAPSPTYPRQIYQAALEAGRFDVVLIMLPGILISSIRRTLSLLANRVLSRATIYRIKRLYYGHLAESKHGEIPKSSGD